MHFILYLFLVRIFYFLLNRNRMIFVQISRERNSVLYCGAIISFSYLNLLFFFSLTENFSPLFQKGKHVGLIVFTPFDVILLNVFAFRHVSRAKILLCTDLWGKNCLIFQ